MGNNSSRTDILLALRTTLEGNNEALAYLDKFEAAGRQATEGVSREWDALQRKLERKFSLPDLSYDLLRGFGIGSAGAVVERAIESFFRSAEEKAKAAAEEMKKFDDEVARMAERFEKIAETKISDWIETLAPADRIAEKKKEIKELTDQIDQATKDRDAAANKVAAATTPLGQLKTWAQGSPEGWSFDPHLTFDSDKKKIAAWFDKQRNIQVQANADIAAAEEKRGALEKSLRQDEKESADAQTKSASDAEKARQQAADASAQAGEKQVAEADKITAAQAATNKTLSDAAAKFRELADPTEKYRQQLAEVDTLSRTYAADGKPFLTQQDAAAAKTRILAEMNDDAGRAIRAAREEIQRYDTALAVLDHNPALTDQEKQSQRVALINEETAAIARLKKELEDFAAAHPGVDVGGLQSAISDLGHKGAENAGKAQPRQTLAQRDSAGVRDLSDPSQHYQSAGEGIAGGFMSFFSQAGTMADQLAAAINGTLKSAVTGITQGIMGWVNGTMTFKQALGSIGQSILQTMLQTIIQMGVQWLINAAMIKLGMIGIETVGDTLRAGRVAKENAAEAATLPAKTAGAAAAGISSWGVALAFGVAAVALIMSLAGGFETGGFTMAGPSDKPAGIVHAGEWVAPKWMVEDPNYATQISALEAARQGKPGYKTGGWLGKLLTTGIDDKFLSLWRKPAPQSASFSTDTQSWVMNADAASAVAQPAYEPTASAASGSGANVASDASGFGGGSGAGGYGTGANVTVIQLVDRRSDAVRSARSRSGRARILEMQRRNQELIT